MKRFLNWLLRRTNDPLPTLDHVPVQTAWKNEAEAQRQLKITAAADRHGRAFLCAATDRDREVIIVPGTSRIVKAFAMPTRRVVEPGNVRTFRRAAT